MAQVYQSRTDSLTDREKATLRLLLAGHDAKSIARELGLSVHTINERLRDARRKLAVSSSREAARRLLEAEAEAAPVASPDNLGDRLLGAGGPTWAAHGSAQPKPGSPPQGRATRIAGGLAMFSIAAALLTLATTAVPPAPPAASADRVTAAESPVTQVTREWLELVDGAKWQDSWAATASSFRKVNTVALWTSVSQKVRVPLGPVAVREFVSEQSVPTPPNGNQVVRFKTQFANKPDATETVALVREGNAWKVVGYYIE